MYKCINVFFSQVKVHHCWNVGMSSGFAIGSLIGGILYKKVGGSMTLRIFSGLAVFSAFMYLVLYTLYLKHKIPGKESEFNGTWWIFFNALSSVVDTRKNVEWRKPDDAQRNCAVAEWYTFYISLWNKKKFW